MVFKAVYGVSLGLIAFMLLILAPGGRMFVSSATPEKVERQAKGKPGGTTSGTKYRSRGPRYIWAGGYRGK